MLSKLLTGSAGAAGALLIVTTPVVWADEPPPPLPNVNAYPSISPAEFAVLDGAWYAFATPEGLTCVIDKGRNGFGCSGAIPAAPEGANMVSALGAEEPKFASASGPLFEVAGPVKPLPPQTRLAYRNMACAIDAGGATVCENTSSQHGFVLSPAGSYVG